MNTICAILFGLILGGIVSLMVIWQRLDAVESIGMRVAAACLQPPVVVTGSQARGIVGQVQKRKEHGR